MAIGTVIKRTLQVLIGLFLLGGFAISALSSYVENSPEAQERLKVSVEAAEYRVDEDAGFLAKLGTLISAWWESDELLAEAKTEKALEQQAKAQRKKEEADRRFNETSYSSNDDYYGTSDN